MSRLASILKGILDLFVSDWRETVVILAILALSAWAIRTGYGVGAGLVMVGLLVAQLLFWTLRSARVRPG